MNDVYVFETHNYEHSDCAAQRYNHQLLTLSKWAAEAYKKMSITLKNKVEHITLRESTQCVFCKWKCWYSNEEVKPFNGF
jgi:hypothetical protein